MLTAHRIQIFLTGVFLVLTLGACLGCAKHVEPGDLINDVVSAEIIVPARYKLRENISIQRAKLNTENYDKWSIPATNLPLTLRLTNRSDGPVHFAYPSDCYSVDLDLDGPGAKYIFAPNSIHFTGPSIGTRHTLEPGESFDISMNGLDLPQRNISWRGFLTEAGTIRIRGSFEAKCVSDTDAFRAVSNWASVEIVAP